MIANKVYKYLQRRFLTYVNTWLGFTSLLVILSTFSYSIFRLSISNTKLHHNSVANDIRAVRDNIGGVSAYDYMVFEPIDAVYTWVNGSDPIWIAKKGKHAPFDADIAGSNSSSNSTDTANEDDTNSKNRFRDNLELKYSLRSLVKYAPWLRRIFLVTDNQIPYWLNLENGDRLRIVSHSEIFADQSILPVFSSPAIESQLHRIPELSKRFIYFNDDVMLGSLIRPDDFVSLSGVQKLYMSWEVPKCNPGCHDNWIGDGSCDKACNVSACNFDYPDCVNVTTSPSRGSNNDKDDNFCSKGCPYNWLGDRVCDQKCNNADCAWDGGDCGIDLITDSFIGASLSPVGVKISNLSNYSMIDSAQIPIVNVVDDANLPRELQQPILQIPFGSVAFYVNTSIMRTKSTVDLEGRENHTARVGFKYLSANSTGNELLQTSIVVMRHDLVVGLMRHRDGNYTFPHDIQFQLGGYNSITNIIVNSSFFVRVIEKKNEIKGWNETMPEGMDLVEGKADLCPVGSSLSNSSTHSIEHMEVELSKIPFRLRNPIDSVNIEGVVVRLFRPDGSNQSIVNIRDFRSIDDLYLTTVVHSTFLQSQSEDKNRRINQYFIMKTKLCEAIATIPRDATEDIRDHGGLCGKYLSMSNLVLHIPAPNAWGNGKNATWIHSHSVIIYHPKINEKEIYGSWTPLPAQSLKAYSKDLASQGAWIERCFQTAYRWASEYNVSADSSEMSQHRRLSTSRYIENHQSTSLVKPLISIYSIVDSLTASISSMFWQLMSPQHRRLTDTYALSLIHVNRLYTKLYGHEARKVPAHMPHMINKEIMMELQRLFSSEWNRTASSRFRSPQDMQYSFSYYYYLIYKNKALPPSIQNFIENGIDSNRDGYIDSNELHTLASMILNRSPTKEDKDHIRSVCRENLTDSSITGPQSRIKIAKKPFIDVKIPYKFGNIRKVFTVDDLFFTVQELSNCSYIADSLRSNIDWNAVYPTHSLGSDKDIAFEMISDNFTDTMRQLDSIRRRKVKFICINDNMRDPSDELLSELNRFYEAMFPEPSIFELSGDRRNPTLYTDEYRRVYSRKSSSKSRLLSSLDWLIAVLIDSRDFALSVRRTFTHLIRQTCRRAIHSIILVLAMSVRSNRLHDGDDEVDRVIRQIRTEKAQIAGKDPIPEDLFGAVIVVLILIAFLVRLVWFQQTLKRKPSRKVSQMRAQPSADEDDQELQEVQASSRIIEDGAHDDEGHPWEYRLQSISRDSLDYLNESDELGFSQTIERKTSFSESALEVGDKDPASNDAEEDVLNSIWKRAGFGLTRLSSEYDEGSDRSKDAASETRLYREPRKPMDEPIQRKGVLKSPHRESNREDRSSKHVQFDVPDDAEGRWYFGRVAGWLVKRAASAVAKYPKDKE